MLPTKYLCGKAQEQDPVYSRKFSCLASSDGTHLCALVALLLSKPGRVSDHSTLSADLAPEFFPCATVLDVHHDRKLLALSRQIRKNLERTESQFVWRLHHSCDRDRYLRYAVVEPEHSRCGEVSHSDSLDLCGQQSDGFGVSIFEANFEIQPGKGPFASC